MTGKLPLCIITIGIIVIEKTPEIKIFGAKAGVYKPTFLTNLGVIIYIRHLSVVGNAGILSALQNVVVTVAITFSTALSFTSTTTNINIRSGGAFGLIPQTLKIEICSAIGIPFCFS